MNVEELITLLINKTQKNELPWRKEEQKNGSYYALRLDNGNLYIRPCGKKAVLTLYSYRLDSNIVKKTISRELLSFLERWWEEKVTPTALEFYYNEISKTRRSPLERLEGAIDPVPEAVGAIEPVPEEWVWQEPVPPPAAPEGERA